MHKNNKTTINKNKTGFLAGASKIHYILILPNEKLVQQFCGNNQLKLGTDIQVTLGPYMDDIITEQNQNNLNNLSELKPDKMYTYSFSKGLYGGLALDGQVISVRGDCNKIFYKNKDIESKHILMNKVNIPINKDYQTLINIINNYCEIKQNIYNIRYNNYGNNNYDEKKYDDKKYDIFGISPLKLKSTFIEYYSNQIPDILIDLKKNLFKNSGHLKEGIFRTAPSKKKCDEIKELLNDYYDYYINDIHIEKTQKIEKIQHQNSDNVIIQECINNVIIEDYMNNDNVNKDKNQNDENRNDENDDIKKHEHNKNCNDNNDDIKNVEEIINDNPLSKKNIEWNKINPSIIANLIKIWFRELPKCLLNELNDGMIEQTCNDSNKVSNIINNKLNKTNKALFLWLIDLILDIIKYSNKNKMNLHNMSVVISPNTYSMLHIQNPMKIQALSQSLQIFLENALIWRQNAKINSNRDSE